MHRHDIVFVLIGSIPTFGIAHYSPTARSGIDPRLRSEIAAVVI